MNAIKEKSAIEREENARQRLSELEKEITQLNESASAADTNVQARLRAHVSGDQTYTQDERDEDRRNLRLLEEQRADLEREKLAIKDVLPELEGKANVDRCDQSRARQRDIIAQAQKAKADFLKNYQKAEHAMSLLTSLFNSHQTERKTFGKLWNAGGRENGATNYGEEEQLRINVAGMRKDVIKRFTLNSGEQTPSPMPTTPYEGR